MQHYHFASKNIYKILRICYYILRIEGDTIFNICFKISKNTLNIRIVKKQEKDLKNINNTNIIDIKELKFSKAYLSNNQDLISAFLNVVVIKNNITKVIIHDYDIVVLILSIINEIPSIKELIIKSEKSINYEMFLKLLDNKHLIKLNIYDIPKVLLERLDINTNLEIVVRSEILFISTFMSENKLNTFSDIYYKKNIIITSLFTNKDHNDFIIFVNINKYLKTITFKHFNEEQFLFIFKTITDKNINHLKFIIEEKNNDLNSIYNYILNIKKKHDNIINQLNLNFKINYSKEYKRKNVIKQLNLNFIKISLISIILTLIIMISINYYNQYHDKQKYLSIENNLRKIIDDAGFQNIDNIDDDIDYIEPNEDDLTTTTTTTVYTINYEKAFDKLLQINADTKGWITVNNTKINYPIVQAKDNDYYLNRDYYQEKNRHGWIFMDYRNDINNLGRNTIIYGHNLADGTMFGTLRYVLNSSWFKKTNNQIIEFNTINKNMKFQIISIYKIPVTSDYIQTSFTSDKEYLNWLERMLGRSIYNFNQEINSEDKILTLSTCQSGNDQRLVVHAKLIIN